MFLFVRVYLLCAHTHLCTYAQILTYNTHQYTYILSTIRLELFAIPKVEELAGQPMFVNWAFSCLSANGKGAAALGRDGGFFGQKFQIVYRMSIDIYWHFARTSSLKEKFSENAMLWHS